jgi:hypothetical protein
MVPPPVHSESFLAAIAHFAEPVRHPKLIVWSFYNPFFPRCLRFGRCHNLRIYKDRQQMLLRVPGCGKFREPATSNISVVRIMELTLVPG